MGVQVKLVTKTSALQQSASTKSYIIAEGLSVTLNFVPPEVAIKALQTLPATLTFLARPKPLKTSTLTPAAPYQSIATLEGSLELKASNAPHFTVNPPATGAPNPFQLNNSVTGSDFNLELEWDTLGVFDAAVKKHAPLLFLPWTYFSGLDAFQVVAELTLSAAGKKVVEFASANSTPSEIPIVHRGVLEDGADGDPALSHPHLDFFGVGTVYAEDLMDRNDATGLLSLGAAVRIPFKGSNLNVFVHPSLEAVWNGANIGKWAATQGRVFDKITDLLVEAGFPKSDIKIQMLSSTVSWVQASGGWASAKKPANIIPFFDYHILGEKTTKGTEDGLAEVIFIPPGIDLVKKEKAVYSPIKIFANIAKSLNVLPKPDDRENYLASVICHEIGHGLGLYHGLWVQLVVNHAEYHINASTAKVGVFPGEEVITGIMANPPYKRDPSKSLIYPASPFGPVHKFALKNHYL